MHSSLLFVSCVSREPVLAHNSELSFFQGALGLGEGWKVAGDDAGLCFSQVRPLSLLPLTFGF